MLIMKTRFFSRFSRGIELLSRSVSNPPCLTHMADDAFDLLAQLDNGLILRHHLISHCFLTRVAFAPRRPGSLETPTALALNQGRHSTRCSAASYEIHDGDLKTPDGRPVRAVRHVPSAPASCLPRRSMTHSDFKTHHRI